MCCYIDIEIWAIGKVEENRILAFEAWCRRRMQRICWREHNMSTEEVFTIAEERCCLMKSLKKGKIKLIGHTLRHNSLL